VRSKCTVVREIYVIGSEFEDPVELQAADYHEVHLIAEVVISPMPYGR